MVTHEPLEPEGIAPLHGEQFVGVFPRSSQPLYSVSVGTPLHAPKASADGFEPSASVLSRAVPPPLPLGPEYPFMVDEDGSVRHVASGLCLHESTRMFMGRALGTRLTQEAWNGGEAQAFTSVEPGWVPPVR